jgi:UDP-N-acetylmuramate dehydrogenase
LAVEDNAVTVGAGTPSGQLAAEATKAGLAGLEWMIGLPGTVGGAIRGNAGMYGGETKDFLESVLVATPEGETKAMSKKDCQFGYRHSAFKKMPGTIILSAKFVMEKGDPAACQEKMKGFLEKKAAEQPVDGYSAGCMFKNWRPKPEEENEQIETIRKSLDLNKEETVPRTATGAIPAGWIIDRAQLKGYKVGHCRVSEKHGNFVINDGQGTASEVLALTSAVRMKIRDMTRGIVMFEDEIEYAGF